jgi:hypothetical protein
MLMNTRLSSRKSPRTMAGKVSKSAECGTVKEAERS